MSPTPSIQDLFAARTHGELEVVCGTSPELAGWRYLSQATVRFGAAAKLELFDEERELAVVLLSGRIEITVGTAVFGVARSDVFEQPGEVVYVCPGDAVTIVAAEPSVVSVGGAPAIARYPSRHLAGDDIRVELRGGGAARRQVAHLLAPPTEAHRLILYEVHVPRGSWSGWPPHCHDGKDGSPYLEETYYFEHRPANGFGFHRNFREREGLDDAFVVPHQSLVTVPAGYHSSAASPGSHMYFLNYLAGDLEHEDRRTPPCFDERYTWIDGRWDDDPMTFPTAGRHFGA